MSDGIFVVAPEDQPWQVTLDEVESWLRQRWPDAVIVRRHSNTFEQDYLSFDATIQGNRQHGSFFDRNQLTLEDGTPESWAETIAAFLQRLPAGSPALGALEEAEELEPRLLPTNPTADQIVSFFRDLADSVE